MPRLPDPAPGTAQGAWQGRPDPLRLTRCASFRNPPPCGSADRHRVEQRLEAGEDADDGETGGRDVEPAGAVPGEAAPVRQPAEAPLDHPAAGGAHQTTPRPGPGDGPGGPARPPSPPP